MNGSPSGLMHGRQSDDILGIQIACEENPDFGIPMIVSPGVWWVRLPVASALQAINVYLLEDGKHLTLVDTGVRSAECREALQSALCHPDIASHQLTRIIVTHYHPDHIGLAGEFARDGVKLWTSRTAWLYCHLLAGNKQLLPLPTEVTFMQRAGLTGIELEAFRRRAGSRYGALVAPPPDSFVPLVDGQTLAIGQRVWRVATSHGHAAEHISLWSEDCVISGDQILPSVSSNLTVPYTESDIDVIGEWLRSCRNLMQHADDKALCLPGHQRPFYGIQTRLSQIEENIQKTLLRLQSVTSPQFAAIECVEQVYGRTVGSDEKRVLLPEVVGMLNHLYFNGRLERTIDSEGVYRYTATDSKSWGWRGRRAAKDGDGFMNTTAAEGPLPSDHAIQFEHPFDEESTDNSETKLDARDKNFGSRLLRLSVIVATCLIGGLIYSNWQTVRERIAHVYQLHIAPKLHGESRSSIQPEIVPVDTMEVITRNQAEVPRQFTGIVKPRRASQIGFNRIGVIDKIFVERGDRVEADTILASLNTNLLKANLKAVEAQYRAAEARLSELVAGPRAQTIESARAQVAAAKAELDLARTSFQRSERLVNAGAVSKQDLDSARTNAAAKEEALKSLENVLDELLEGTRSEQVLAQRAQLSELEASIEQLQVQLDESVLLAPFAAIVSDRFVEPGAVTAPGAPAFRLIDAESPEVWIGVAPDYTSAVQDADRLVLTIGDKVYESTVKSVLPELDETTRTNTVILELHGIRLNNTLFGQVAKIDLSRKVNLTGFWVPLAALTQGDQGLWALLALAPTDDSETFILKRQEVEVIQVDSDRAFVRGTVDSGTKLVSSGVRRLTPGQQVKQKAEPRDSTNVSETLSVVAEATRITGVAK